jgi:hypothetical protein
MLSYLSDTVRRVPKPARPPKQERDSHATARVIGCHRRPDGEPLRNRLGAVQTFKDPILDAESWSIRQVETTLQTLGMYVTASEKEEFVNDVQELLLKLEKKFNPDKNPSFAGYAAWIVPRRLIDLIPRQLLGRNGGRIAQRSHDQLDDRTPNRHQTTVAEEPSDLLDHRRTHHRRLERNRTGETAWAHTELGIRAA